MRSFLLILATLVLIGGGFALYYWMQPAIVVPESEQETRAKAPTSRPVRPQDDSALIGAGSSGWVKRYNPKTGELASQFRAAHYNPQKDGTILVDEPEAEFVLDGGRLLRVEGRDGNVIIPQNTDPNADPLHGGMQQSPPSRGTLRDVKLTLFDSTEDEDADDVYLTITMNNVVFDNDTFRITTESYVDPAGDQVPGDQVPVVVRGKDYDFDGRGLVVRWNDLNQRLELLEIEHGERLAVKNPELMQQLSRKPKTEVAPTPVPKPKPATRSAKLKKKKKRAATSAPVETTAPTTEPDDTLYRASFERDVQIFQGDVQLALADTLSAEFLLGSSEKADQSESDEKTTATDEPATKKSSAAHAKKSQVPVTTATTEPVPTESANTETDPATTQVATTESTTEPATQPSAEPIIVLWQGKLRVTPIPIGTDPTLEQGEGVVRLTGSPLQLNWQGTTITCGSAMYVTSGQNASFEATDAVPVVTMTDKRGAVVTTRKMTYSDADGIAVLSGASIARIPTSDDPAGEMLKLSWDDKCSLRLLDDGTGDRVIDGADIVGNVNVDHPRMDLSSDTMKLAFAKFATGAEASQIDLERLIATGNVRCRLKGADEASDQTVHAKRLELETAKSPAGKLYPHIIKADEDVVATDTDSMTSAKHVVIKLRLATRPTTSPTTQMAATIPAPTTVASSQPNVENELSDVELESVVASGNVRLESKNGPSATADRLTLTRRESGNSEVQILGSPQADATLSANGSTLRGQHIVSNLEAGTAEVLGAGALHSVKPASGENPDGQPFDLAWVGGASLDAKGNQIVVREKVQLSATQPSGGLMKADADRAVVTLADKPKPTTTTAPVTQPTTSPTTKKAGATSMFAGGSNLGSLLEDKEPIAMELFGAVKIDSSEVNEQGDTLRGVLLKGEHVTYDIRTGRASVPGPGQMLVQDHRPAVDKPDGDSKASAGSVGDRGATAFEWKEQLAFDNATNLATMQGDVAIHHVPDPKTPGREFWLNTNRLRAELVPKEKPAMAPATTPATTAPSGGIEALSLNRIVADGGVHIEADHKSKGDAAPRRIQLDAREIEYSSDDGILIARGDGSSPVRVGGSDDVREGSVEELRWNTRTDQLEITKGRVR